MFLEAGEIAKCFSTVATFESFCHEGGKAIRWAFEKIRKTYISEEVVAGDHDFLCWLRQNRCN